MSRSELVEQLNNCESVAKKLSLEVCQSVKSVKCLDVLKCLRNVENHADCGEKRLSSISPPFPSRRKRRTALHNCTNCQDLKYESRTPKKFDCFKDASNPGTIAEMVSKVPSVEKYYDVKKRVGWGTFSSVFLAVEKQVDVEAEKKRFALKHVYTSSSSTKRVLFETKCLREIGGCNNVVGLRRIIGDGSEHVLVMPYFKHDRFSTIIRELSFDDVRDYLRNLLIALRRVHKFNVIHRDVKPSNFLFDTKTKNCALVDFGLAQNAHFYKPSQQQKRPSPASPLPFASNTRPKSAPKEANPAKPTNRVKSLGTHSLHTRSSSMVAMAKSIHQIRIGSRKRSAGNEDAEEEINILNVKVPSETKKLRTTATWTPSNDPHPMGQQLTGTPRPTVFRQRPGFGRQGIPIYLPNPQTPSPLSTSSERALTSPLGGGSTGGQMISGKTIGDVLPCIRSKAKNSWVKPTQWSTVDENPSRCTCRGKQRCSETSNLVAPRAGTSGFRPPEVLIQCPHQTTAVDVWSAGVMFLSLLSGRYPFFKPTDDMESLVQMIAVFGTEKIKNLAKCCGKKLSAPYFCSGHKLQAVVEYFRKTGEEQRKKEDFVKPALRKPNPSVASNNPSTFSKTKTKRSAPSQLYNPPYDVNVISSSAYDLLERLLDVDPLTRISAKEALEHPFFTE